MNRNTVSRFDLAPQVNISRSRFNRNSSLKTSFDVGEIIPIYLEEVLPGDTFDVTTSKVCRLQTLKTPVMDNLFLDTYFFFVPNRLVWEHWQNFCGENTASAWIPTTTYSIPQITSPASTGWDVGTLADYFGIPTGISGLSVNALPFRAYAKIIDDWFRDQNLCNPLNIPVNDSTVAGVNTGNFVSDVAKGGLPYVAAKYHDYFTSALPGPQKGPDVVVPLGTNAPVFAGPVNTSYTYPKTSSNEYVAMLMQDITNNPSDVQTANKLYDGMFSTYGASTGGYKTAHKLTEASPVSAQNTYPINLYADLNQATAATINQLRQAFQIQRLYEKDARGGTRYISILKSHYGVTSPDARLQRSEYLGGNRVPLNITQVTQFSSTTTTSPMGDVAGMSVTADVNKDFSKSFVEHGYIIGLACARYEHTYQQGINRLWSRTTRFDFYWPVLANIGEQAIKNKEIYAQGTSTDNEVFGYQEAWADYRYKPNTITGEMRSSYSTSLDIWHFGDDYSTLPTLSDTWIEEDKTNIDRSLAVPSTTSNQIFADFFFKNYATRAMPLYSVPGLIDHN